MRRSICAVLVSGLILAAGIPVWAHHSFAAAYDTTKQITVQGTIVQVRLTNPHSWFFLDVKDANTGAIQRWAFEAGTPSGMIRNGFKSSEIKAGTVVTIKGFHARDASQNAGMLQQLIMSDGKTYGMFGPQEGAAGAR
jgi:DNA/RNA endonuclease YhcR with UshA esterase domain